MAGFEVGQTVQACKALWGHVEGKRLRAARSGDQGVVCAVLPDDTYAIKFQVHGLSIVVRVSYRDLAAVRYNEADLDSPRAARYLMDRIIDRETARLQPEELASRLVLLREILALEDLASMREKLVQAGFVTKEEWHRTAAAYEAQLAPPKYPWSHLPSGWPTACSQGGEALAKLLQVKPDSLGLAVPTTPAAMSLLASCLQDWAEYRRRVVQAPTDVQKVLLEVAVERVLAGLPACRWGHLPVPGATEVQYGEGIAAVWEQKELPTITLGAARGMFLKEHLRYLSWTLVAATKTQTEYGLSHVWQVVPTLSHLDREDFEFGIVEGIQKATKEGATYADAVHAVLSTPPVRWQHMTVNLIGAVHNFHRILVKAKSRKHRKKQQEKQQASGASDRSVLVHLDAEGLHTWRAIVQRETAAEVKRSSGWTVGEHARKGHRFRPWVLKKNLRPGEEVLAEKSRGDVTYYQVSRWRKKCHAGQGPLKERHVQLDVAP